MSKRRHKKKSGADPSLTAPPHRVIAISRAYLTLVSGAKDPAKPFTKLSAKQDEQPILLNPITVIGRDPESCQILIADDLLCSRNHAHIVWMPDAGAYRVTDLASKGGTYVNGEKIENRILKPGDLLRVGMTEMRFDIEIPQPATPKKPWIVPERRGFRYLQLGVTLLLVCTLLAFPFDDGSILPYWGKAFANMWSRLTRPVQRPDEPQPAVAHRSPDVPISPPVLQPATRHLQPDSSPSTFDPLSVAAWSSLEIEVRQSIADGDFDRALSAINTYTKGPYFARYIQETYDLEKKVNESRRQVVDAADRRAKELRALLERCRKETDDLIVQERFDDALAMLHALRTHKALEAEASLLIAGVHAALKTFVEVTLPRRRELVPVLYTELRPFTARLDFAGALKRLKDLEKDARFQGHRPLLVAEGKRLEESGQLYAEVVTAVKAIPRGEKLTLPLKEGGEATGKFEQLDEKGLLWLTEGAAEKGVANHVE